MAFVIFVWLLILSHYSGHKVWFRFGHVLQRRLVTTMSRLLFQCLSKAKQNCFPQIPTWKTISIELRATFWLPHMGPKRNSKWRSMKLRNRESMGFNSMVWVPSQAALSLCQSGPGESRIHSRWFVWKYFNETIIFRGLSKVKEEKKTHTQRRTWHSNLDKNELVTSGSKDKEKK